MAGYKINIQKSVSFLYANNELTKGETKKAIPLTITTKRIKYLGINLTKEVKDLYTENCKTLLKEIEEDTNKWKDIPCSWIRRISIVKMPILPKAIYRFSANPIKISRTFFTETEQKILTFIWNHESPQTAKAIRRKKRTNLGASHCLTSNYLIKQAWYWQKKRYTDQWNRIESPEINPCIHRQLIYGKGVKNIDGAGKTGQLHTKKKKKK